MISFSVLNRFTLAVQFTAEIDCKQDSHVSIKLGLAVKWAIKNKADLRSADLSFANLRSANLSSANLSSADLRSADLRSANLRSANLRSADLRSADLRFADLSFADLSFADLRSADLRSADLRFADLRSAKNSELVIARTVILPGGELDVWKKCRDGILVQLTIPRDARRSSSGGRKCRAEFADVVKVHHESGVAKSTSDAVHIIEYRAGTRVTCHEWDDNRWNECSGGIHFYLTKEEAEAH